MAIYKEIEATFINPYNFVPIKGQTKRNINAEEKTRETHTGHLHCSLTVKTPVAIPDVENISEDGNEHKTYSAFRINNKLAIPGSSIRGMLRSVYEAATNSCMLTIDPNEHITKRSDLGTFSPCVLKRNNSGKWELYPAERIALVGFGEKYKRLNGPYEKYEIMLDGKEKKEKCIKINEKCLFWGQEVEITTKELGHKKTIKGKNGKPDRIVEVWNNKTVESIKDGKNTGCFLYLGEAISNKHAESVFKCTEKKEYFEDGIIRKALEGLEETLKMYRSESVNRNLSSNITNEKHYGYYGYERAKSNGVIPLWYKYDNGSLKVSLAAIGRIAFDNDIEAISNYHSPCVSRKKICPACSLFGMVGTGDENNGLGSLIRVTDAIGIDEVKTTPSVTIKELGTPRTSYLKFYSEGGKGYDDKSAMIRGRKFYWHIPAAASDASIYSTTDKTKRNATFELINAGSRFEFDIYYDGLDEEQLKMLLWTIQLPSNCEEGRSLMHKMGHGKPLGLGSVELKVEFDKERIYADDYEIKDSEVYVSYDNKPELLDEKSWKKMELMLEYDLNSKKKISYPEILLSENAKKQIEDRKLPLLENVIASHQWFKKNIALLPNDREGMKLMELSEVEEKDFDKRSENRGNIGINNTKNNSPLNKNNEHSLVVNGIIKKYFADKGYGFIECKGKEDVILHKNNFHGDLVMLKPGTKVEFELGHGRKGKIEAIKCCLKKE